VTHLSMFSGAGISDVGFHAAGFQCLAQVEIDKAATNVRKRHFPDSEHYEDITDFDATRFRGVGAVFGGFPCQDYSVAGKRSGLRGDRGALWWELHRVIRESHAPFIGLENVPGLLSSDRGIAFGTILTSLVELGYSVSWRVLNLRYFGVPQRRRRVLIVGHLGGGRAGEIQLEPSCLSRDFETRRETGEEDTGDVARCLRSSSPDSDPDLDNYIAGSLSVNGEASPASNCNDFQFVVPVLDATRGANADPDRPSFGDLRDPMYGLQAGAVHGVAFAQNSRDEVRCLGSAAGALGAEPGMKQQTYLAPQWRVRRLTPRECERLMGLPDDFTRWGADGKEIADGPRYKMLGNGWSVPQAKWQAERILEVAQRIRLQEAS
jgi:DNA (cytosine-5)-methyltransferase 1